MELQHVLKTIRHQWYLVVGAVVVALVLALGWILLQTPMYKATAEVFVSSSGTAGDSQAGEQFQAAVFAQQRVTTYAQLVSSPEVLDPVIEELGLATTPQDLARVVSAVNPPQTVLIEVSATDPDPAKSAAIANLSAQNLATAIQNLETTNPKAGSPIKVSVVNPAVAPASPYFPNKVTTLGLALLLGLAAGIGAALLRDQLDTSVKSSSDLLDLSGTTPLGVIGFDPNAETTPLSALDQQAPRSESFRQIRTNLQYVDVDNPPKVLAVTSSVAGEGKSTAACNLAISMAQSDLRVCLVEADLRRPKVADYLGVDSAVGLTDVLAEKIALEDALIPWSRDLLALLPSGGIPPNPSELLASEHMKEVLLELRADFDAVIADTQVAIDGLDGIDLPSQDVAIGIKEALDKDRWLLSANLAE